MAGLRADYLVIGAGASAMAFVDEIVTHSDATVIMVDRRHRPGGHWNDAYPFVRLHQPAAYYGVNSRPLGTESIDQAGPNAGWYERVTAAEIIDYFSRVLDEHLLASGRVRFLSMSNHEGEHDGAHVVRSLLTGETITIEADKVVDATYLESRVPSTTPPPFAVDEGATVIPVNDLTKVTTSPSGFTVIGAGKTSMDAVSWLLDNGVEPDRIRWIRPRDAWMMNRAFVQPRELVSSLVDGVGRSYQALVDATDIENLFDRLEAEGCLLRLDPTVIPTMYRCAIISPAEIDALRTVRDVVRLGHVTRIGRDEILLEQGAISTDEDHIHVNCSTDGLVRRPPRPMFEPGQITIQQVRFCSPTFNAALVGFVETLDVTDAEKNALCPPNPYPDTSVDWVESNLITNRASDAWGTNAAVTEWLSRSRLNVSQAVAEHLGDLEMQPALTRLLKSAPAARDKMEAFLAEIQSA